MSKKTIAEKLLSKPHTTLWFANAPQGYLAAIGRLPEGARALESVPESPVDLIQVFVAGRVELEAWLPRLRPRLAPKGLLWITYHKRTSAVKSDINRDDIWPIAQGYGLKPVRQIAIDADWSALCFKFA